MEAAFVLCVRAPYPEDEVLLSFIGPLNEVVDVGGEKMLVEAREGEECEIEKLSNCVEIEYQYWYF